MKARATKISSTFDHFHEDTPLPYKTWHDRVTMPPTSPVAGDITWPGDQIKYDELSGGARPDTERGAGNSVSHTQGSEHDRPSVNKPSSGHRASQMSEVDSGPRSGRGGGHRILTGISSDSQGSEVDMCTGRNGGTSSHKIPADSARGRLNNFVAI